MSLQLKDFNTWNYSDTAMDTIMGFSRQFSHLAGVNLTPKGKLKSNGGVSTLKFSVSPKPLKWKGVSGWENMIVVIYDNAGEGMFFISVNGNVVPYGSHNFIQPIKKAFTLMEIAVAKLKKDYKL